MHAQHTQKGSVCKRALVPEETAWDVKVVLIGQGRWLDEQRQPVTPLCACVFSYKNNNSSLLCDFIIFTGLLISRSHVHPSPHK